MCHMQPRMTILVRRQPSLTSLHSSFIMHWQTCMLSVLHILAYLKSVESYEGPAVPSPCLMAKQRRHPKSIPYIRVIDEVVGQMPDIVLGNGGEAPYYVVPPGTLTEVVIECSSSLGRVSWNYRGKGVTAGIKVIPTVWTAPNKLKPICYSSALVMSNLTDQLTGDYTCVVNEDNRGRENKKESENSFLLFVPQPSHFYYEEGSVINITIDPWTGRRFGDPVILPCISKQRSGAVISLYEVKEDLSLHKMSLGKNLKYDPFLGFTLIPTDEIFNSEITKKLACKFDRNLRKFPDIANRTLLEIQLSIQSEEKFAPEVPSVREFSPYFSWTMRNSPTIEILDFGGGVPPMIWQQLYIKNDFEEWNESAAVFHLGSIRIVERSEDDKGSVRLIHENGTLAHKWDYHVLDKDHGGVVGLSYLPVENYHVFTCISATTKYPPVFTFKPLVSDETYFYIKNFNGTEKYIVKECPDKPDSEDDLSCMILTTTIPTGEVTCGGDGVHKTIRYPLGAPEPSRPFFIERGSTIDLYTDDEIVITLPCLANAPESQYFVHLFRKRENETEFDLIWSLQGAWEAVEFYPNWGFHIDTSAKKFRNPTGKYLCTSSPDLEDMSDSVLVTVTKSGLSFSPKETEISGTIPYSFSWAWSTTTKNIQVREQDLQQHVMLSNDGRKWASAELILTSDILRDFAGQENITITLINDKKNGTVEHQWTFHVIDSPSSLKHGLTISTKRIHIDNADGGMEHEAIEMICRGPSHTAVRDKPALNYYLCQNPDSCDLINRCNSKNCNSGQHEWDESEIPVAFFDKNCNRSEGCLRTILKSIPLNGYLKAACKFNGITEEKNISNVFFKDDIKWKVQDERDLVNLYVNTAIDSSVDQNPDKEVRDISSNLEWDIGDTIQISCGADPTIFTNGIRWALEDNYGQNVFQKNSIYDSQWKYASPTQILSTFTHHIENFNVKRVWCFVPIAAGREVKVKWVNVSQPIFIRPESGENCHETEPSIRLINIYPSASRVALNLTDTRLDGKEFVVPEGVLQFAVRINSPEPVEWSFISAFSNGPSMTPMIQSDRHITNYYDPSTYCYTSKLLVNLRNRSDSDTGRYIARFGRLQSMHLDFFMFVPGHLGKSLIKSGTVTNQTVDPKASTVTIPCLSHNPRATILLLKKNHTTMNEYVPVMASYNATKGFTIPAQNEETDSVFGTYKCMVEGDSDDYLLVNLVPEEETRGELKYEQIGELRTFTCTSQADKKPNLELDGNEEEAEMKECLGGCAILITPATEGIVRCIGDGVNMTYDLSRTDSMAEGNMTDGVWFDRESDSFRCRMDSDTMPKLVAVKCHRPNECSIMQKTLYEDGDTSQSTLSSCGTNCAMLKIRQKFRSNWPPNWFSVYLRCSSGNNDIFAQYFNYKGEVSLVTKYSMAPFKDLRLDIVNFQKVGSQTQAKLRCFGNRYFYSRGFQWALQNRDGTMAFRDPTRLTDMEVQSFNDIMSEVELNIDENSFINAWCFAPFIDSPRWANVSVALPITKLKYF